MNLWTSTSNEFLIHGEVLTKKTTVGIFKISCSGFALAFFPLSVTYCKIFIRWRRLLRSNYCLSFFIHPRYKDLLGNLPQDVKDDRYCTILLNRIAGYGSVSITLCNYKSSNFLNYWNMALTPRYSCTALHDWKQVQVLKRLMTPFAENTKHQIQREKECLWRKKTFGLIVWRDTASHLQRQKSLEQY